MQKVPPSESSRPPAITMSVLTLRRLADLLDVPKVELLLVKFILQKGRDLRWTMYIGTNVADEIGCRLHKHTGSVKRGLRSLEKQGWIVRGKNDLSQRYVQLTREFIEACELAQQRYEVRQALGSVSWRKINGDDVVADELHELSLTMTHSRYRDRVRAAAAEYIINVGMNGSTGYKLFPRREQIVPSQGTNRPLVLIKGERKYGH